MTNQAPPLLACRGVTKRFGPVLANQDIDLDVYAGEVQAILGENGAGKSTLMSILAGRYRPDAGEIRILDRQVRINSPRQALDLGVGMVYQRFMLVEPLTVLENLSLALGRLKIRTSEVRRLALELGERYGFEADLGRRVAELSMGQRQRVEILKLLLQRARVLIFDEPTAVLAEPEVEGFFRILQKLKADGRGVLFITHKLEEVLSVADRIAILRHGRIMARIKPEQVPSRKELARLMVGREFVLKVDKDEVPTGEEVLSAVGLAGVDGSGRRAFEDVSFCVRSGEILAFVGVAGNGQEPLAAALAGSGMSGRFVEGRVRMGQETVRAVKWPGRHRRGLAYVPEDRYRVGGAPGMTLWENFLLTRTGLTGFWRDRRRLKEEAAAAVERFKVKATGPEARAGQLSGGNLQKFLLARELSRAPNLFIAEQPTQGLDVQATEDVWKAILDQRKQSAVLLFTSDLKEALSLADRVAVMFRGRILETVDAGDEAAISRIGLLMAGAADKEIADAP